MKGGEFDTKTAPFSFIDLEMTGLEAHKHEIVEIGLIKVSQPDLEVMESWEVKVRPENLASADEEALQVNGFSEEKWKGAISLKEAMEILAPKVAGTILAGWNIATDYAFLDAAVTKTSIKLDFHKHVFDVHSFAAAKLALEWGASGLNNTAKHLGVEIIGHHSALPDSQACFQIYKKLITGNL